MIREIGRGGMGVVYEAEQLSLGRRVALKVLPFAAMLDKQQLTRFKNEARAAATLDHPNIVAIYSVGVERGVHYYAMQLIEGQSLAQVVEQLRAREREQESSRAAVSESRSVTVSQSTASPARGAHPILRTVALPLLSTAPRLQLPANTSAPSPSSASKRPKPSTTPTKTASSTATSSRPTCWSTTPANSGSPTSAWPASKHDAGMTMTGDILGTLRYMSPEQALAKRVVVDHRSDIYSLGVTLYELLTLQPAFTGDDRQELLRQIAFEEPRKPRQINARIPQDLETIILKAIEKNPADRYATAQELADDLRRFLDNKPIAARRPTLLLRARKLISRHRVAAAMIVAAAGFLLVIATAFVTDRQRQLLENNRFVEHCHAAKTALEADSNP